VRGLCRTLAVSRRIIATKRCASNGAIEDEVAMDRLLTLARGWISDLPSSELNVRCLLRSVELVFRGEGRHGQWSRPELLRELALLALILVVPGGSLVALSLCALQRGRRALAAEREPT
jgi:hypothetical protein